MTIYSRDNNQNANKKRFTNHETKRIAKERRPVVMVTGPHVKLFKIKIIDVMKIFK